MLDAKKLGLAGGIVVGVWMFLLTLIALYTGFGKDILELHRHIWYGYEISLVGAVLGLVYGFIKGFIFFSLLGLIYNKL